MNQVGKVFRFTEEGRRVNGFSAKARVLCVEAGPSAGIFQALDANGKPTAKRWVFRWSAVECWADEQPSYVECGKSSPLPATPACMRERGHKGEHQSCSEDNVLSTWSWEKA